MNKTELRKRVMAMSDEDVRMALFSLARQLDEGDHPSIINLLALFEPTE